MRRSTRPLAPRRSLVALMALIVMLTSCSWGDGPEADTRTAPQPPGLAEHCPPTDTEPRFPEHGTLRGGATAVRLCNAAGDLFYLGRKGERVEEDFQPPAELLTTGVEEVIDTVNHLPAGNDIEVCGGVGGSTSVYWFLYPDGDARAVTWLFGDCADVHVGPDELRSDGSDLHEAFATQLARQRSENPLPAPPATALACNPNSRPTTTVVSAEWLQLHSAVFCRLDGDRWREGDLTHRQVELLNQEFAEPLGRPEQRCDPSRRFSKIVGETVWGDVVALYGSCDEVTAPVLPRYPYRDEQRVWHLSPRGAAMLGDLDLGPPHRQRAYGHAIPK